MLLPELQRMAQSMGITGVARMRKSQLIEAIQSRQGGSAAGPMRSATPSAALDHSATRSAPAGADAPRHREQDAMEPDRPIQPGQGEGTQAVTRGQDTRPASSVAASSGQLTFGADTGRVPGVPGSDALAGSPPRGGEAAADGQGSGDGQQAGDGRGDRRRRNNNVR